MHETYIIVHFNNVLGCWTCCTFFANFINVYLFTVQLLMLPASGLPSFNTVIRNYRNLFLCVWSNHSNEVVKLLRCVCVSVCIFVSFTALY